MSAEVSITLKAGPGYDEPWVIFKGTVPEVGAALEDFRHKGLFGSVKAATAEFREAPVRETAQAFRNVQRAIPGSAVIPDQQLPASYGPKCSTCGGPAEEKSGKSQKEGKHYKGVFCTKDQTHKPTEFSWI